MHIAAMVTLALAVAVLGATRMNLWRGNADLHVLLPLVTGRPTACVILARISTDLIGMPDGGRGALWKPVRIAAGETCALSVRIHY